MLAVLYNYNKNNMNSNSNSSSILYRDDISRCLEHIKAGESYEICLTQKFQGLVNNISGNKMFPLEVYSALRNKNPAPYSCYIHYDPMIYMDSKNTNDNSDNRASENILDEINGLDNCNIASSDCFSINSINIDSDLHWYQPGGFSICSSSPERYLKSSKVTNMIIY